MFFIYAKINEKFLAIKEHFSNSLPLVYEANQKWELE